MIEIEKISISDIIPSDYNPRLISDTEYSKLSNSIDEFGVVDPIIINLKNNHIIGGHQRYDVLYNEYISSDVYSELNLLRLGDIGWVFPTTDLKISDEQHEKALNLALNKISGEWDNLKLETLLTDLNSLDFNVELTGFNETDLTPFNLEKTIDELTFNNISNVETDTVHTGSNEGNDKNNVSADDDAPTIIETTESIDSIEELTTTVKKGDLYQLGNHRLLCGDAMDSQDVELLMNGVKADTVFTDPPYDLKDHSYRENIKEYSEDANIFIMNSDDNTVEYLKQSDFEFVQFFVANFMFTLPRQNRAYLQHILISHETKGDALHCRNIGKGLRSVINMKYRGFLKDDPTPHKHQKSIDFVKFILEHYVKENVLDLFGGSGTTLVACEELGVNCYMVELEPLFVQVIIDRYEKLTGVKPVKIN